MQDDASKVRRCYVIAWGGIIRQPQEKYAKNLRSIKFAIRTGRGAGRTERHLVCTGYGEHIASVVMRAMDKGDVVMVAGTWTERKFRNRKGQDKMYYELNVHFAIPQELIGFLLGLYSTKSIAEIVEQAAQEDADVWESD